MPERPDIADWPSPRRTRPRRTCFLSSQMNAIRGFSAPLNGVQPGHLAKMSSHQKQETPRHGGCGTHIMTNVEIRTGFREAFGWRVSSVVQEGLDHRAALRDGGHGFV